MEAILSAKEVITLFAETMLDIIRKSETDKVGMHMYTVSMAIILLALQVNEFLQMQTVYKERKAIGIKLEHVPSLPVAILQNIMAAVKKDKSIHVQKWLYSTRSSPVNDIHINLIIFMTH